MVLAYCTTYYHLFNVIQLKLTTLAQEEVDLVLSADTDFTYHEGKLKLSGLFKSVILSNIKNGVWTREFNDLKSTKQKSWFIEAVKKGHGLPLNGDYSDLYIGLDDAYNKFLYYCLLNDGCQTTVHLFDEGTASYVLLIKERTKNDHIPHDHFMEGRFDKHIKELLLYAPELRTDKSDVPIGLIPKIDRTDEGTKHIFNNIFSYEKYKYVLDKKYIYFEGGCFQDFVPTLDIEVLDLVADMVGKENINVKLHPRTRNDRFTRRGYHVLPKTNLPWEIISMNEPIQDKIYLSNASTAALTTKTIFDISTSTINLFQLDLIEKSLYTRQKDFPSVYRMQEEYFNKVKPCFFTPRNEQELREIVKYLEMEK